MAGSNSSPVIGRVSVAVWALCPARLLLGAASAGLPQFPAERTRHLAVRICGHGPPALKKCRERVVFEVLEEAAGGGGGDLVGIGALEPDGDVRLDGYRRMSRPAGQ